jgi:hypothetical protein
MKGKKRDIPGDNTARCTSYFIDTITVRICNCLQNNNISLLRSET